ncbi:MAG: hypothetical protein M3Z37_02010 [Candidatus Eremiobacteraeota bacterium]|nr:hypothetical protein [Candidatus Eremiobacteraeota bacterium]
MAKRVRFALACAVLGIALCAFLFVTKSTGAASDPHGGCPAQLTQVDEALSQLSFSKSAAATVRSAVRSSKQRQVTYLSTSAALEQQLFRSHASAQGRERVETDLAKANLALMDDSASLQQAQTLLGANDRAVALGSATVAAAAQAIENGDCAMGRRLTIKSGWPRESPYKDLSAAARFNVEASAKLDVALDLIVGAERAVRRYGGAGSTLR